MGVTACWDLHQRRGLQMWNQLRYRFALGDQVFVGGRYVSRK